MCIRDSTGLDGFGDVHHLVIVEVQARDSEVALGLSGFFFDAGGLACFVAVSYTHLDVYKRQQQPITKTLKTLAHQMTDHLYPMISNPSMPNGGQD